MKIRFNYDGIHRPDLGVRSLLRSLHLSDETGVLKLWGPSLPDIEIHFHEGALVACTSDLDEERVLLRAMDLGGWDRRRLNKIRQAAPDLPLLRLLQEHAMLDQDQLQGIANSCVRDNLLLALGSRWREATFEHADAVFPSCVSLDLATDEWLDEGSEEFPLTPPGETTISTEYHLDRDSLREVVSEDDEDIATPRGRH